MPKEKMGIREQVHIVLRGADGKVKDERKLEGVKNVTGKKPKI